MKKKVFKYSALSLVVVNFWSMYIFFAYFFEDGMFRGVGLFFNYVYSVFYAVGFGVILLIIRLFFHLKKKTNPLKTNFFYILGGIFNLNLFIAWLISMLLGILGFDEWIVAGFVFGAFLISVFIFIDIYKSVFAIREN